MKACISTFFSFTVKVFRIYKKKNEKKNQMQDTLAEVAVC